MNPSSQRLRAELIRELRFSDRGIIDNRTAAAAIGKEVNMSNVNNETLTQSTNTVAANMNLLAKAAVGLVDRQSQLELDNVGLFAQTALFVREVLADIQKVKEFIKQMETLGVKMSPDLRQAAGMNLTEKEKSKLGQTNMLLPMMRAIFHSKEGKLRSFENYAYPMTQLLKDESLVTLEQLRQAVDDAVYYARDGGKTLRGIEALRTLERESRSARQTRSGSQSSGQQALSPRVAFMKGMATLPKDVAATIAFNEEGFGLVVVRKASDGSADVLYSAADTEDVTDIAIKGWEKVADSYELDPRYKVVDFPASILSALKITEAA